MRRTAAIMAAACAVTLFTAWTLPEPPAPLPAADGTAMWSPNFSGQDFLSSVIMSGPNVVKAFYAEVSTDPALTMLKYSTLPDGSDLTPYAPGTRIQFDATKTYRFYPQYKDADGAFQYYTDVPAMVVPLGRASTCKATWPPVGPAPQCAIQITMISGK